MIYRDQITVTASAAKEEPDRILRLERVIGYICALGDHYGNDNILSKITELHDHEGTLIVTWLSKPSSGEEEFLSLAWRSPIGDGTDNEVQHKYV